MLAHLRQTARQHGWRVTKQHYEGMREVFRGILKPHHGYGQLICVLEECAAKGLLSPEKEPRPAAEVIELFAQRRPLG
jgi:hypothetical protein